MINALLSLCFCALAQPDQEVAEVAFSRSLQSCRGLHTRTLRQDAFWELFDYAPSVFGTRHSTLNPSGKVHTNLCICGSHSRSAVCMRAARGDMCLGRATDQVSCGSHDRDLDFCFRHRLPWPLSLMFNSAKSTAICPDVSILVRCGVLTENLRTSKVFLMVCCLQHSC